MHMLGCPGQKGFSVPILMALTLIVQNFPQNTPNFFPWTTAATLGATSPAAPERLPPPSASPDKP